MSKDKPKPRLTPEQNEARQAARAAKRAQAKDAHTIALLTGLIKIRNTIANMPMLEADIVFQAARILDTAKLESTRVR